MRWLDNMSESVKKGIRNWLNIMPAGSSIQINEVMDFELSAIRNRIWYRGDGNELEQLYQQSTEYADRYKFWASTCTPGMEMRKIHTGLPKLIVRMLTAIVLRDMNDIDFEEEEIRELWNNIDKRNYLRNKLKNAVCDVLCIGDGAWKIVFDTKKSEYPILRWYPGDRIELVYDGDDLKEIIFKTPYKEGTYQYILHEHYGYGYIVNRLYKGEKLVEFKSFPQTRNLTDVSFNSDIILAVRLQVYESAKFPGRGGSIYDGKLDNFDALDESWSQWMDALRAGRARSYIPESLVPHDPKTGQLIVPNPFDNRYFKSDGDMGEGQKNEVNTVQTAIPHDSYIASYSTALDLCLQGIISPSTLGIDMKKLDNADAQREKEKATLYTRNAIVEALQDVLPELIRVAINAYQILHKKTLKEIKVDVSFGEYANPSFESQVETVSKGKQGGIISLEAAVEELYGDTKDEEWKMQEVARLKAEQGITEIEEPALNLEGIEPQGNSEMNKLKGVHINEGQSAKQSIQNEQNRVSGTA